ncbi:hypothetical protein B0681_10210 [Moraxella porci DSM 25326]|uniref:Uncharacterized protein n=1 Tax=Moraxella porci DSM 25326 TaxID=573983 RepID=A0A1T0CKX5_9GAMM|nr:hypothetical protein [Moraxella porci]OOS23002.1 hypothetical protein B0681_10210 [Moraxella porci DSM 25326]
MKQDEKHADDSIHTTQKTVKSIQDKLKYKDKIQMNNNPLLKRENYSNLLDDISKFTAIILQTISIIFIITIIFGFMLALNYSSKIQQNDLVLELFNSPNTFLAFVLMLFVTGLLTTFLQLQTVLTYMFWLGKNNSNKWEFYIILAINLVIGLFILFTICKMFGICTLLVVVMVISLSIFMAFKFNSWWIHILSPIAILAAMLTSTISQVQDGNYLIFEMVGITEKKSSTRWYLIYNNGNADSINGLRTADITQLQTKFNSKAPSDYWAKHPNALYGYMKWNIGSERVLCNVADKDKEEYCLRLPKENIQAVPELEKPKSTQTQNDNETDDKHLCRCRCGCQATTQPEQKQVMTQSEQNAKSGQEYTGASEVICDETLGDSSIQPLPMKK